MSHHEDPSSADIHMLNIRSELPGIGNYKHSLFRQASKKVNIIPHDEDFEFLDNR